MIIDNVNHAYNGLNNYYNEFKQIFPNVHSILVPKKAEYNLKKYVPKSVLREIDNNVEVAIEKCLLVLSNLATTYYVEDCENHNNRWKRLNSIILHEQTKSKNNTYIYPKIIAALTKGTAGGPLLEVSYDDIPNIQSRNYRIPINYFKAGLTNYFIKDSSIVQNRNRIFYNQLNQALENPICNNLIRIYPKIDLPTREELTALGKQLVKAGYLTKKGKILTMRNKHKNDYWSDAESRSFVEDGIKIFEYLTKRGFMIPSVGDERSGGRVVDSFTLMPSWIRSQITIDGNKLCECDYTALHPNIAMKLYGGKKTNITHQKVAEELDIELTEVKKEHLSFFNKNWHNMRKSRLFNYYSRMDADMLSRLYNDKRLNGYKITSRKMFKVEVEIMTAVIKQLNSIGVYVLYVYDALLCESRYKSVVIQIMNQVVLSFGIRTSIKTN